MRLIDADALKAQIQREIDIYFDEDGGGIHTAMEARDEIDYAPTVDAESVRHGKWNETNFMKVRECSCCHAQWGIYSIEEFDYCPSCGAKMDAQEKEE